mmetsp:Transcript_10353/g.31645  ORF Transcript_10353/g.31645 Transcript_10353/m.31645 type:complete len:396 (+) Transcript_10353:1226-2413(+)
MLLHWLVLPGARVAEPLRQGVLLLLGLHLHRPASSRLPQGHLRISRRGYRGIVLLKLGHDLVRVQGGPRQLLLHDVHRDDVVRLGQLFLVLVVHLLLLPLRRRELRLEVLRHIRVVVLLLLVLHRFADLASVELEEGVRELELVQGVQAKYVLALVSVHLVPISDALPEKVNHGAGGKSRGNGDVLTVVRGGHEGGHRIGVHIVHVAHQVRVLRDVVCLAGADRLVNGKHLGVGVGVGIHVHNDLVRVVRQLSRDARRLGHLEGGDGVRVPNEAVLDDPGQVEVRREAAVAVDDAKVSEVLVKPLLGHESGHVLQRVQVLAVELGGLVAPQPLLVLVVCPRLELVDVVLVGHNVQVVLQSLKALRLLRSEQPVVNHGNAAELDQHCCHVPLLPVV